MEPNPHEKKDHPSDLAPSAGPTLADSQAMSRKRSHGQANAELTSVPADQSTADAEVDNLGQPAKRPKSNRHSSWMWAGDGPHHGWSPSYVAMTKCDFCSLASRGVVHQCNDCKLTVCGDCVGKGKLEDDEVHHIKPGSLNWEVPKKTKVTATSSSSLPPKPRGGLPPSLVVEEPEAGELNGMGDSQTGPQLRIPSLVLVVWQEHQKTDHPEKQPPDHGQRHERVMEKRITITALRLLLSPRSSNHPMLTLRFATHILRLRSHIMELPSGKMDLRKAPMLAMETNGALMLVTETSGANTHLLK
ncbi:hypothetical protein V2G26_000637 [Clonostachys chloroleuca]